MLNTIKLKLIKLKCDLHCPLGQLRIYPNSYSIKITPNKPVMISLITCTSKVFFCNWPTPYLQYLTFTQPLFTSRYCSEKVISDDLSSCTNLLVSVGGTWYCWVGDCLNSFERKLLVNKHHRDSQI